MNVKLKKKGVWAYDGWNNLCYVTEELESVDILIQSIHVAVPLVVFLYLFVNLSYFIVLSPLIVSTSNSIAVDFADQTFGEVGFYLMPLLVALSAFGAANGTIFSSSRLVYSAARDNSTTMPVKKPQVVSYS